MAAPRGVNGRPFILSFFFILSLFSFPSFFVQDIANDENLIFRGTSLNHLLCHGCAEIPGFYFNVEKNRYFPIKDPIPGRIRRLAHPVAVEEAAASSSSTSSREDGKAKKVRSKNFLFSAI